GINHLRLAPRVLHDAHVANPDAVGKTRPHAFDDGFLGREAHGQEAHGTRGAFKLRSLGRQQQVPDEALAVLVEHALDPINLQNIDADAENHGVLDPARVRSIKSFISRTALASPSMMARATIE